MEESSFVIATISVFPKCSLARLRVLQPFCLEPPLYRGVAYNSAAKYKIITAKISVRAMPFLTFHEHFLLQTISAIQYCCIALSGGLQVKQGCMEKTEYLECPDPKYNDVLNESVGSTMDTRGNSCAYGSTWQPYGEIMKGRRKKPQ